MTTEILEIFWKFWNLNLRFKKNIILDFEIFWKF